MSTEFGASEGWILSGFQAQVVLWLWVAIVLLYGVFRSFVRPEPDAIRPAGPDA